MLREWNTYDILWVSKYPIKEKKIKEKREFGRKKERKKERKKTNNYLKYKRKETERMK